MSVRYNHILAYCPIDGLFEVPGLQLSPLAKGNYFSGSTNCPACGRDSEFVPGVYDSLPNGIRVLLDPSISRDALAALQEIAQRLQRNEVSPENAVEQASAIDPKFGRSLGIAAKIGPWAIPVLLTLLQIYLQLQDSGASDKDAQALLSALAKQTSVLEQIAAPLLEQQLDQDEDATSADEAEPQSKQERAVEKTKSKRRNLVYKLKRQVLKQRRLQFGGSRSHP